MAHEVFHYGTLDEVRKKSEELGAFLPLSEDVSCLFEPLQAGGITLGNRLFFQPMEGTDGTEDGAPGELTCRRYMRFAASGASLIWFEAVATLPRVRASAHQLWLTNDNADEFKRLLDGMREESLRKNGFAPVIIMQATNSGRYSKPTGKPDPVIAYSCPPLEAEPIGQSNIASDSDLKRFEEAYEKTARLCRSCGFDGMDIKCCHRYLASELLSAYERLGRYGGSFENRTRFLKNCYRAAQAGAGSDFLFTSRMNAYDGFMWPFGFGVTREGGLEPDMTEAIRLIRELKDEFHIPFINITMGNPYKNPHVNRPYDRGGYVPDEHPITGLGRMMKGLSEIQQAVYIPVLGSAFSYLRQYSSNLAAGMISGKHCAMAGFGREALAYPGFIEDLRLTGQMDATRCCVTCGGCAQLLRAGTPCGCVVRDREVYKL